MSVAVKKGIQNDDRSGNSSTSASASALQKSWEALVDVVAGNTDTTVLPKQYSAISFLPEGRHVNRDVLTHVSSKHKEFESEAGTVFRPQMSFEEGCRSKPNPDKFYNKRPRTTMDSHQRTASKEPRLFQHEGPDLLSVYASMERAEKKKILSAESDGRSALQSRSGGRNKNAAGSSWFDVDDNGEATEPVSKRAFGTDTRIASGFVVPAYFASKHRQPDFMPIILISSAVSAPLQLVNISEFLEDGRYVDPTQKMMDPVSGYMHRQQSKQESVIVSPGSFLDEDKYTVAYRRFRVVDDPKKVDNWRHVCACIVDGKTWQLEKWFPVQPAKRGSGSSLSPQQIQPSHVFKQMKGYLPYFEEDKIPTATQQWNVTPLVLTRRIVKSHMHLMQASIFWEQLYTFLETHPYFKVFTVPADD